MVRAKDSSSKLNAAIKQARAELAGLRRQVKELWQQIRTAREEQATTSCRKATIQVRIDELGNTRRTVQLHLDEAKAWLDVLLGLGNP